MKEKESDRQSRVFVKDLMLISQIIVVIGLMACLYVFSKNVQQTEITYGNQMHVDVTQAVFLEPYSGTVEFVQEKDHVNISGSISGLTIGTEHGVYITLTTPIDGKVYQKLIFGNGVHGCPGITNKHRAGDLGNFTSDKSGQLDVEGELKGVHVSEILGRNLVIVKDKDTCEPGFNSEILTSSVIAVNK